ncbi:MAG: N-acetyl-gamma-glutamyl-phosphate reductase [Planctomycetes bacterium]|nr:N-acetyl-gamma-glutamyl-phosphate reductase [Planctomycetota bacterium]
MTKVGIIGATAYSSLELIKILLRHAQVKVVYLGVRREGNPNISSIFPCLGKLLDLACTGLTPADMPEKADLVFSTLPPTISMQFIPPFLDAGVKVVDFSADYRFKDKQLYEKWYGATHSDVGHLPMAVYGLPEMFRAEIKHAELVANPGCYPTCAALGLLPLVKDTLIDLDDIIVDAKSGVSGAGREPTEATHYPECNESIAAYKVGSHRHQPEIIETVSHAARAKVSLWFTPHLTPMDRGILSTIYANLKQPLAEDAVRAVFSRFYRDEPFVRVRHGDELPKTKDVMNTNFCDLAVKVVGRKVIILSCIDNLIKGASGQAVQNMNIMLGLPETAGLV